MSQAQDKWGNIRNFPSRGLVPPREPPHDGGMEARVAKLESTAEHMRDDVHDIKADLRSIRDSARTDFRILFGAIIAVALGLAGLMARGFHWL